MGILNKFNNFLEKKSIGIFSNETASEFCTLNDKRAYITALKAVDYVIGLRGDDIDSYHVSVMMTEPGSYNIDDCLRIYHGLYGTYSKLEKNIQILLKKATKNHFDSLMKDDLFFQLRGLRIILFIIAHRCGMVDRVASSGFFLKLRSINNNSISDAAIDNYVKRNKENGKYGVDVICDTKEQLQYHKDIIGFWSYLGL